MKRFLAVVLCTMTPAAVLADSTAQAEVQRFVDGVRTLSATFEQVQSDERGRELAQQSGRLWLSRPGRFYWAYEEPYEQLIVSDGEDLWMYEPDLTQATRRPAAEALPGTPAALLSQQAALTDAFDLEDAGSEDGHRIVRLLPRSQDGDFRAIDLWLRDGHPSRMRFHDLIGGITDVRLSEVRVNHAIDESRFRFEPPEGTEVISADE